jgi:hypothetical protein
MAKKTAKRKKGYPVPLPAVLAFAAMLKKQKHLTQFLKEAENSGAALTMDAKTVAFVRTYLDYNKLHPEAAKALKIKPQTKAKKAKATAVRARGVRVVDPCPCVRR